MGQAANWTAPNITQITADTSYQQFQAAFFPVPKTFKFGVIFINVELSLDTLIWI